MKSPKKHLLPKSFFLFLWISSSLLTFGQLRINEFLSSNSGASLLDENGDDSDWIEIFNSGTVAVNLAGYTLTDDSADLQKWTFPSQVIQANSYLLVFASNKDRAISGNELHTNFRLSASGEYLALLTPSGVVVSEYTPTYPIQEEDISYGFGTDGVTLGFFINPSPGSANSTTSAGRVADTSFQPRRGIYSSSQSVTITSETDGAQIRYTLDGSDPTATSGTIYTGPISVESTTVIRAAAFKSGLFPTNIDTHSYLFPNDIRTQYANGNAPSGWPTGIVNDQVYDYGMDSDITSQSSAQQMIDALTAIPSVMITTPIANLTDADTGIYSNAIQRGRNWERPANVEFLYNDTTPAIGERCGLRIRGGFSRQGDNPKHAFRVFFRQEYGNSKLEFPIFEEEGVDSFDSIDFRTAQNYSWSREGDINHNTFLRDILSRDIQRQSGQPYTRSRYYHLYLNGVYWGLFVSQERAEASFGESYLGGDEDNYDTIKSSGRDFTSDSVPNYITEATDGNLDDWRDLWNLARAQNNSPTLSRYMRMQGLNINGERDVNLPVLLDADNLIDYMMIVGYIGGTDNSVSSFIGPSNNWFGIRDSLEDEQGFSFFLHDTEHSLGIGRWRFNNRMDSTLGSGQRGNFDRSNPQFLHFDLASGTEEYRLRFADRAHAALFNNGYLTTNRVLNLLTEREAVVDQVIIAESARWGDAQRNSPARKSNWVNATNFLKNAIRSRSQDFLDHLRGADLYPNTDAPTLSPFGGQIPPNSPIQINATSGTIYITTDGSDPRLIGGNPNPSALIRPSSSSATINLPGPTIIKARARVGSEWSALTETYFTTGSPVATGDLVISEVNYNPLPPQGSSELAVANGPSDFEFIELLNVSDKNLELQGAQLSPQVIGDHLEGVSFTFAEGAVISPGGRIVIVANLNAFLARYPTTPNNVIFGEFSGSLGNSGEWIRLQNSEGVILASFRYNDTDPWPLQADGQGSTLQLTNLRGDIDYSNPLNWASFNLNGSPGIIESTPFLGAADADSDLDGSTALLEYYVGSSDNTPNTIDQGSISIIEEVNMQQPIFSFIRDPNAIGIDADIQESTTLDNWSTPSGGIELMDREAITGGLIKETYRVGQPRAKGGRLFIRLRLQRD